ncbi:dihydropyrimidinase [Ensifer adhaerens]|uniref:dihydropyrimidinase n=1 Tax=Ensifer adhaerens TaxID=106592 RepID=UPI001CBD6385|nr:dihydropyrimidinase [Ensifer adhaerens]MBZ7924929.1 dihydropyrimidinase [Ensifer adhaerens]UAX95860.1 dihydropyrimidinase [Ensifer adhaerens]UAY04798.1 dihydropyrimidinase [Ensifer adhaerens]UAY10229.1 dihydropyrimidinase [Ensifer adhaerens]
MTGAIQTEFDLVVRNGTVVLRDGPQQLDIGIRDGRIVALEAGLGGGRETYDAKGKVVLPGGVDSHCHMDQQPWEGRTTSDDFQSGTLSALCGGNTTVIPFAMQVKGNSIRAIVDDYHLRAAPKAHIDYAFHMIVGDASETTLEEVKTLVDEGCTSIKIFLTYDGLKLDDYEALKIFELARREGAMVMVHAENDGCIRWLTEHLLRERKTQLRYFEVARSTISDREATHRAISLAELLETPILIAHVASAAAVDEIRRARARGLPVFAETCPQYLFLSSADLDTKDLSGAKCICTPPPRHRSNQPEIWRGILDGTLGVFSSDHSPLHYVEKIAAGPNAPFNRVPGGLPGLETRLPLLFSGGVNTGRMTLQQFAEVTATEPARLYGLYPRKGVIAIGSDADLAIWDANREVTIKNDMLHHATDHTPYEDMRVRGWPIVTISRGEVVWEDGVVKSRPGRGQFLPCDRPFVRLPLPSFEPISEFECSAAE